MKLTNHLLIGAALAFLPALAFAVPVTLDAPSATFQNAVGGTSVNYPSTGDHAEVRWGDPLDTQQSGLGFDVFTAPITEDTGVAFNLGTLTHFNWPIATGTAATSVELAFGFTITDPSLGAVNYLFPFVINETPNNVPSSSCAYPPVPSDNPCPDIITFTNVADSQTFTIGGVEYTLSLLGFGQTAGSVQDQFITQEGQNSSTGLWAKIDVATPPVNVPEPNSLLLMALGLLGLGGAVRLRRKQKKV